MLDGQPLKNRSRDIAYLIGIVKNSSDEERSAAAARMLGDLNAVEASRVLLEHIELRASAYTSLGPLSRHPAAQALGKFGSPIYPSMFGFCGAEQSDVKIKLLAYVMREIDGKEVGVFRLRNQLEKYEADMREGLRNTGFDQTNPAFVGNLKRLIDLVGSEELDKVQNYPWNSPR